MPTYNVSMGDWLAKLLRLVPNTVVIPAEWVRKEIEDDHEALKRAVERLMEKKR